MYIDVGEVSVASLSAWLFKRTDAGERLVHDSRNESLLFHNVRSRTPVARDFEAAIAR